MEDTMPDKNQTYQLESAIEESIAKLMEDFEYTEGDIYALADTAIQNVQAELDAQEEEDEEEDDDTA